MKVLKLHGSLDNLGGIVAFQKSLKKLNARSSNSYWHFQTGRKATSRFYVLPLFRYLELFFSYLYFPFYLLWLRPDVIELNSSLALGAFRRDYWYARVAATVLPSARLVLFNHGWDAVAKKQIEARNRKKLLQYFHFFDCIVVLAERFQRELALLGVFTPVEVITTAIDLNEFLVAKKEFRNSRVLFLSRLEKNKGLGELMNAVLPIVARYPGLEISIAGTGSYEHTARTHYSVSSCPTNIRFYGYVRGDEKRDLLMSSDIFVFPSYTEGCPISVLEALAVGLPLVYTPVGALPDFLENGQNGIEIQSESSKSIAEAVLKLLDHPDLMMQMSENNRVLSRKFDLSAIHKKLEEIYQSHG